MQKILITGSNGFLGKNLKVRLSELPAFQVTEFNRDTPFSVLKSNLREVDCVIHLAGENRPKDLAQFEKVNHFLTKNICDALARENRKIPIIFTSSSQVHKDNAYGSSKMAAEGVLARYAEDGNPAIIYRLPNVFGKWCRPNYNSVVATFCHNIALDLPVDIHDPAALITLVYVDDVINSLIGQLTDLPAGLTYVEIAPVYSITVGDLYKQILAFKNGRRNLLTERVGNGLVRALYSTYVSYLPVKQWFYAVPVHADERGIFVEMLKTMDSGQFSYFTANPGVTRGSHYHHTKTEKFLVIKGSARFRFRHIINGQTYVIETIGTKPEIVETIPGFVHDITNIGSDEMIVMIWANEVFDRKAPDTIQARV